ncbi:MAG TPA: adenylate/guanylate cyclase domain-containing protein [Candidatus Tectomicrobia bacterium]|nr:adenylate/guanylate cyclase domain-containing protein [Candidatus Tectomicrobia bacterium]
MTFEDIVDQAIAMLQRRGRVAYRTLKRQFQLDDEALTDLKTEIIRAQRLAVDEDGDVLVWTGGTRSAGAPDGEPMPAPVAYTPAHLAEKILLSKTALEGERKQVTVLFADLKGSMELLADRDPEEARQLLDPVLERMMAAVHRYEGTVNQVMGDGIMALFGAPIAHEDHAVRACYAALAMQEAIRRYGEEVRRTHGITVQMRVGLNSGEVVVRAIGNDLHMDYSAIGQTTHLAARMEQLTTPGSILLTAETLQLAEGFIQVKVMGPVPVKGLAAPVEVFELVGATTIRRRLHAAVARGLTRFVGREVELAVLQHALERAGAGHGQVVAVLGEAGVGKSRLVYESIHSHRTQGWLVLESASVSYGKATPYFPVIDLLKRYAHVEEHDDARTMRAKVTGQVLTLDEALQETIPAFLALLEALPEDSPFQQLDPPQRRQRTLDALKRVLLRESQLQPLLLVFEDLHWIDSETQALLDNLVESLPTARLLLLVNYRPEYQHGWGSKTYYTQQRLDPLPPASAEELLQALLGDDPSLMPLRQLLIARTEGNPFFLEESVRALVETGALMGEPGAYQLAQALPTIHVPATVQAVLTARIDRLPAEEKRLLQTAAAIGHEVPWFLLQAIAEVPEEALHRGLAHLQTAEFLYETRLFPELEYTFKHALTHEVAYGSLLQERRRALHGRIVEALETLAGDRLDDQVDRVAQHALRGEVWEKAVAYCRRSGVKAGERSALREAAAAFEQALVALAHLPENRETSELTIDVHIRLQRLLWQVGDLPRMLDHLQQAYMRATALGDQKHLAAVFSQMSFYYFLIGHHDRAVDTGERALAIAKDLADIPLEVETNLNLGRIYLTLGEYRRAMTCLRWNTAALDGDQLRERFGERYSAAGIPSLQSRTWLGRCLAELGAFGDGIALAEGVMQVAEESHHPFTRAAAYRDLGHVYLCKGILDKAIPALERGLSVCQVASITGLFPIIASLLGDAYALAGRVADGLPLLEKAVEQATSSRLMYGQSLWVSLLAKGYLLAGRLEDANARALQALEFASTHKERGYQASALRLLGEIHVRRDPLEVEPAEEHYRQALALADELGMRPLQAHCHFGLGSLYAKIGRREQARCDLSAAIELYRAMDMTFWLPQTEAALAEVEGL